MEDGHNNGYCWAESCRSRQLLGNLDSPASAYSFFFPGLYFFGFFIYEADIFVEICLVELENFPAGLEEDFVKFHDLRARAQHLEHPPRSDWSHIDH